jgi:16S rRNA (guanine966-N2)-methyltransferase
VRIVAGEFRGRTIAGPTWDGLRPTSDALRETLFNVLGPTVLGLRVLDAFAGTGAVGIEALSRGAAHVTFVERDPRAIRLIENNITKLVGAGDWKSRCAIVRGDFTTALRSAEFDLVFMDPPYELPGLAEAIDRAASMTAPGGRLIVEHGKKREVPPAVAGLGKYRTLTAGDSALSFYTALESASHV